MAGAAIAGDCKHGCEPPDPDECLELLRKIKEHIDRDKHDHGGGGTHGLRHRWMEQAYGKFGPPPGLTGSCGPQWRPPQGATDVPWPWWDGVTGKVPWCTHDDQYRATQKSLNRLLKKFNDKNCPQPLPADAYGWATRPAPKPSEHIYDPPIQSVSLMGLTPAGRAASAGRWGLGALGRYLFGSGGRKLIPAPAF